MTSEIIVNSETSELPVTYERPPIVEVALSIQFSATPTIGIERFGEFWSSHKAAYPDVAVVPSIPPCTEDFGHETRWRPLNPKFSFSDKPECRLQMKSSDGQWMAQLQADRVVVNWLKKGDDYSRFPEALSRFVSFLNKWTEYLDSSDLAETQLQFWELSYVNRIEKKDLWATPADWPSVFPGLFGEASAMAGNQDLRGFQGHWVWHIADPLSNIYVDLRPGVSKENASEDVIFFRLTARGPFTFENGEDRVEGIKSNFSGGRAAIANLFNKIISTNAKQAWGYVNEVV